MHEINKKEKQDTLEIGTIANEILPVEVRNNKGQKLLVIGAYRPDSDSLTNFMINLDHVLCNSYLAGFNDIIVTGDFNTRNINWDEDKDKYLGGQD